MVNLGLGSIKLPCGCENRKEIMGAGEWKMDAILIGVIIAAGCLAVGAKRLVK